MRRRQFLQNVLVASSATCFGRSVFSRQPIARKGPPRFQLGLAAYSFRNYFPVMRGKAKKPADDGPAMDMFDFIDYCVEHGFDTTELTSYFFAADAQDAYFLDLKRHAFERGITICGTAIGNNFTLGKGPRLDAEIADAIKWIDRAAVLGAPHIRFFAGTRKDLEGEPERMVEAIEALEICARHAATKGIYLGVENHGRLTAHDCLTIMKQVESPWIGMNLDTGNFVSDDPYADLELCAPYAVNVQVKATMQSTGGQRTAADLDRIVKILRDANYQGSVVLEYEENAPYENVPKFAAELRKALGTV